MCETKELLQKFKERQTNPIIEALILITEKLEKRIKELEDVKCKCNR